MCIHDIYIYICCYTIAPRRYEDLKFSINIINNKDATIINTENTIDTIYRHTDNIINTESTINKYREYNK